MRKLGAEAVKIANTHFIKIIIIQKFIKIHKAVKLIEATNGPDPIPDKIKGTN